MNNCLCCGNELKGGRSDRKFCNSSCRSHYHNKTRLDAEQSLRKINNILRHNWKILKRLNPKGYTTLRKSYLIEQGYDFNYFTNVYKTQSNRLYYFCYDVGIAEVDSKLNEPQKINIVEWQSYMDTYQVPIAFSRE